MAAEAKSIFVVKPGMGAFLDPLEFQVSIPYSENAPGDDLLEVRVFFHLITLDPAMLFFD